VVEARTDEMRAMSIWPGGTSGVLGSPNYFQFLERWLTNESMSLSLDAHGFDSGASLVPRWVRASAKK
jgi:hypothetical protein